MPCPPRSALLEGATLADLKGRYGIDAKRHNTYPNLVQLKYSMIGSPMDNPIVQESRGIILDEHNQWRVVSWPFKKFFNYGEGLAADIDWNTARVQEKLDGSMMSIYFWDGQWHVASSGLPDASGAVQGTNWTFAELFWNTWKKQGFKMPSTASFGTTFIFEIMSPYNRIVVSQAVSRLALIGTRSIWSGAEAPIRHTIAYNPVREFALTSIEEALLTFEKMDPLTQEGYVIVDSNFNRVKVKHPGYIALHHMKSSFSVKRVVEVIRTGECSEVLSAFPEWKGPFEQVTAAYDALVIQLEQDYEAIKDVTPRKDFALLAQKSIWPAAHFTLLDKKEDSVKGVLKNIPVDKLVNILGVKDLVLEGTI